MMHGPINISVTTTRCVMTQNGPVPQYDPVGVVGGDCLFNDAASYSDEVSSICAWEELAVA